MAKQTTLRRETRLSGVGLHTGKKVELVLKPAKPGNGIVLSLGGNKIRAGLKKAGGGLFSLHAGPVITIEHLLAAIYALELDNVELELSAKEVPIMDGSALPFVSAIEQAGLTRQGRTRKELFLKEVFVACREGRLIAASPAKKLSLLCAVDFSHPLIGRQVIELEINPRSFKRQLAPARTFGWEEQAKLQRRSGLIKGAGLHNAVLFGKRSVKNPEGLRFRNEPVRHKALDILGALALLSGRLNARITAYRSGHSLDLELIQKIGGEK